MRRCLLRHGLLLLLSSLARVSADQWWNTWAVNAGGSAPIPNIIRVGAATVTVSDAGDTVCNGDYFLRGGVTYGGYVQFEKALDFVLRYETSFEQWYLFCGKSGGLPFSPYGTLGGPSSLPDGIATTTETSTTTLSSTTTLTTTTLTTTTKTSTTTATSTTSVTTTTVTTTTITTTTVTSTTTLTSTTTVTATSTTTASSTTTMTGSTETSTTTMSPFVGTDPVTFDGRTKTTFKLPNGKLVLMLQTPDVGIYVSAFSPDGFQQWFNHFVVMGPEGRKLIHLSIKDGIANFNRTRSPPGAFESLDIKVRGAASPLASMPKGLIPLDGTVSMLVDRLTSGGRIMMIGRAHRECVEVTSPSLHVAICSAPATEYYDEQWPLSIEYAHLDMLILETAGASSFGGVLPEIWGTRPRSPETQAMVDDAAADKGVRQRCRSRMRCGAPPALGRGGAAGQAPVGSWWRAGAGARKMKSW